MPASDAIDAVDWAALADAAAQVRLRGYAPYSAYLVGAAGLTEDGRTVTGCNVENASFGVTLCAECGLVSELHRGGGGRLVAVLCHGGPAEQQQADPVLPCGRCRQLLWEHGGADLLVGTAQGPRPMGELLVDGFGPQELDR